MQYMQNNEYGYLIYDEGNPAQLWRVLEKWALPSGAPMVTLQAADSVLIEYAEAFWPMASW